MQGMNRTSGAAISDAAHLQQSIADILGTPLGSRLMRRDYGSLLPELMDQPDNGATRVRLHAAIAAALMRWEPRIRLSSAAVTTGTRAGQVIVDITGTYIRSSGEQQLLALRVPILAAGAV
ncbi:baseplate assembly protein [Rubrivivax gelatinosus]|uniref:Baseplate assembly protein n=2 Tax=Rubrivivax gelatinosus TaxID=28068 RepID=A0ABS1DR73_RUBGE|nr:GPW/gp25 family protein [Rubrivivax gelatinosus]MBK1711302.1 baseplate assembly protein [Rubrivivax gelatinosus]